MKIFRQKAGVISQESCWVCVHQSYLYIGDTLPQLLWIMITKWNNDKYIVGY